MGNDVPRGDAPGPDGGPLGGVGLEGLGGLVHVKGAVLLHPCRELLGLLLALLPVELVPLLARDAAGLLGGIFGCGGGALLGGGGWVPREGGAPLGGAGRPSGGGGGFFPGLPPRPLLPPR